MHRVSRFVLMVLCVALVSGAPLLAAGPNWDEVKASWGTLTDAERASYEALMAEELAERKKTSAFGLALRPVVRTPDDMCGSATNEIGALPFADGSDTTGLTDDYDLAGDGACAGGGSQFGGTGTGADIAYRMQVDVDCDVAVNMAPPAGIDMALYVVTDCAALAATCEGVDDAGGGGTAEDVAFSATAGTDYFVIVDGFNGGEGPFNLTVTETTANGCTLVPVELQSFSID